MYQRNTVQRKMVLQAVRKLKNHPTADEVYAEVIKDNPNISKATVYRGLHELSESGEIREVEIPNSATHYDHTCTHHYHVHCISCGKVFDVDAEYCSDSTKLIKDTHGFAIISHDIVFKGICPNCQNLKSEDILS